MAANKPSIILIQHNNPRYCPPELRDQMTPSQKERGGYEAEFSYKVEQLKNLIAPAIGTILLAHAVKDLIDTGVEVTIRPVK